MHNTFKTGSVKRTGPSTFRLSMRILSVSGGIFNPGRPLLGASRACACVSALASALALGAAPSTVAADSDSARERFDKEAAAGWQRLRESISPVIGSLTRSYEAESLDKDRKDPTRGQSVVEKNNIQFWLQDGLAKMVLDRQISGSPFVRRVFGVNSDYAFIADEAQQNGAYYLTECGQSGANLSHVNLGIDSLVRMQLQSPYGVGFEFQTLIEIVKSHEFQILRCQEREEMAHGLCVEVEFTFRPTERMAAALKSTSMRAMILLDPSANWRVVRSTAKSDDGEIRTEITYSANGDNPGDIARLVRHYEFPTARAIETIEFTHTSYESTPRSEFYLPALGLPDCPMSDANNPWHWRTFLIGVNLVVVGVILLVLYQRHRRRHIST